MNEYKNRLKSFKKQNLILNLASADSDSETLGAEPGILQIFITAPVMQIHSGVWEPSLRCPPSLQSAA